MDRKSYGCKKSLIEASMKYKTLFGKTTKTIPSDLSATSHKLLYKGGFIRQVSAGRYAFLPLGFKVWQKILNIIDAEMEKLGSQRMTTPILHPIEIWQSTNRDAAFGNEMHIIEDHHGSTFALGATAEGLMVELVKKFSPSYKELPFYIHQFIGKFRDEKRPKGGILRVREFIMKDAYSFDTSEENLKKTYEKFFNAYLNIAKRLDLDVYPVLADSGAIGGDTNHEFIVKSDVGEAYAVTCDKCDYAAQIERATSKVTPYKQDSAMKEIKEYVDDTVVSCEILAEKMGLDIKTTTKTIMFKTENGFVAVMIRGDYDINETKLKKALNSEALELAAAEDIKKLTGAKVGFVGPINLPKEVRVIADLSCEGRINFEVGGNKTGVHLYNVNFERDLKLPEFMDVREIKDGDTCSNCDKGKLSVFKGIEWGHCFKLDQFYSKPHKGHFVDNDGVEKPFWMGSYGIGLGRSMATIVETHNDEKGIIWPENVAPFKVHLIGLNLEDEKVKNQAEEIYKKLKNESVEVLFDNRETASAGEKFSDCDLIGCPYRVVVSKKTEDKVEIKKRTEKNSKLVDFEKLLNELS